MHNGISAVPAPLLERERELRTLHDALAAAFGGTGSVTLVQGQPKLLPLTNACRGVCGYCTLDASVRR